MLRSSELKFLFLVIFITIMLGGIFLQVFAQEESAPTSAKQDLCELKIEGKFVERLVLQRLWKGGPDIKQIVLDHPGASVKLPAGEYHVKEIHLQGGYLCELPIIKGITGADAEKYGWFPLSPDKPYLIHVGNTLKPSLSVYRVGQLLRLQYTFCDEGDRTYTNENCNLLPKFTVLLNDEPIGSGIIGRYG
jgi:hypothetical protein